MADGTPYIDAAAIGRPLNAAVVDSYCRYFESLVSPIEIDVSNRRQKMKTAAHATRSHGKRILCSPGRMPLEMHKRVGGKLKMTYRKTRFWPHVDRVRCILDDWAMHEHPDQKTIPNEEFNNIYYGLPAPTAGVFIDMQQREKNIICLREVREILSRHYPTSAALSDVLTRLDRAILLMENSVEF